MPWNVVHLSRESGLPLPLVRPAAEAGSRVDGCRRSACECTHHLRAEAGRDGLVLGIQRSGTGWGWSANDGGLPLATLEPRLSYTTAGRVSPSSLACRGSHGRHFARRGWCFRLCASIHRSDLVLGRGRHAREWHRGSLACSGAGPRLGAAARRVGPAFFPPPLCPLLGQPRTPLHNSPLASSQTRRRRE